MAQLLTRIKKLESRLADGKPPGFVWAAVLTEIEPGRFRFDFPEHMRGQFATREQVDKIPMIVVDFFNGKMKGRAI